MTTTSDLAPNPSNPRQVDDHRLGMLRAALEEFGDLSGIVWNRRTGQLVGGHQRIKVLPEGTKIEIIQTYDPPTSQGTVRDGWLYFNGERFSYREVDWPLEREKIANLAANKSAGTFDASAVADVFRDIRDLDIDLDMSMFDTAERDKLLEAETFEPEDECETPLDQKIPIKCPSCGHEFIKS